MTGIRRKGMVFLLGGNSLASRLADLLLDDGWSVTVSLATDMKTTIPSRDDLAVRRGRLNEDGLRDLLRAGECRAVLDASHPYAEEIRRIAPLAAEKAGVPYFSLLRAPTPLPDSPLLHVMENHVAAAAMAPAFGAPILSTVGINNLPAYIERARMAAVRLVARVLPESRDRCVELGMSGNDVIPARGPFSAGDNVRHIRESGAGVLILKDSGVAGGTPEKLEAAQCLGIQSVVVRRPSYPGKHYHDPSSIAAALNAMFFDRAEVVRIGRSNRRMPNA